MCGIAGFLHFDAERRSNAEVIKRMADTISHRGPDGEGFYINQNVALGHRRLSIIDLTTGQQPMYSDDKKIVLVFNGEIYNYLELKQELILLGNKFTTTSDTEVIINAYRTWGVDCQKRFNGMWAFALWDETLGRLFISRDRIGEKPLFFSCFDDTFIFSSEIKSIFSYGVPRIENLELLEIYLTLDYIPAPFTFYKNVHKLNAGHYLTVSGDTFKEQQYWDLPAIDENNMLNNKTEIFERFETLFTDSIKIRMRSDVPYGAFLSGGLDSSAIVALMSEISSYPVETFTIGFNEKAFDERYLAMHVSKKFNTHHHERIVEPDTIEESLNNVVYHYDEPFGDASAIPTGHISKFASSKVKMVLTGDGGDEVLSGYTIYQGEKFASRYQKLPGWVRSGFPSLISIISKQLKGSVRYKLNRIQDVCNSSNLDFQNRYLSKAASIDLSTIKQITKGKKVYPIEEFFGDFMKKCTYKDSFYKLMYLNLKLSLPDDMLVKVDRMSMAHSLETRAPFLDFRLIEYMAHVHKDIKMRHFERKTVLRKTIGPKLPQPILNAPKRGFAVPLREWFKEDSFGERLNNLGKAMPFFNQQIIRKIIQENKVGKKDFGNFIWLLLVLERCVETNYKYAKDECTYGNA
ncbi:MAG TPA: asparagine synthase (glutamine-hydrolyzing) [Chitinophagaceae bacterium]|nr:asparagine synthase (glutamine-hydrolyzing) [Chitinophagaceae bacterium]